MDVTHLLVDLEHRFHLLPLCLEFGIRYLELVIGQRRVVLLDEGYYVGDGFLFGHLLALQVVGLHAAGHEHLEFGEFIFLGNLFLEVAPLLAQLSHVAFGNALLAGVHDEVIELLRGLGTGLLDELHDCGVGRLAQHQLTDLPVTDVDTHFLVLLVEQCVVDHLFEHLLLAYGGVGFTVVTVLLFLSRNLCYAVLEIYNVNLLTADFCG